MDKLEIAEYICKVKIATPTELMDAAESKWETGDTNFQDLF